MQIEKKKKKKKTKKKTKKQRKKQRKNNSTKKQDEEGRGGERTAAPPAVCSGGPRSTEPRPQGRCGGFVASMRWRSQRTVRLQQSCMEMLSELPSWTYRGDATADYLHGKIHAAGNLDVDVDVPGKELDFYEAFNLLDEHLHGPFPQTWPDAYDLKIQPQRDPESFLDTAHLRGSNDGSVHEIVRRMCKC